MKVFFIFNVHAGKGAVKRNLACIFEEMSKTGAEVTAYATQYAGDAKEKVKNLPEGVYDRVVCAGGDGTLDEVVSGMNERREKLSIGYIPGGSTNDYAVSLGLPKDIAKAARISVGNNLFESDLGDFNGKSFVYVAAFGLFTEVTYETPQKIKNVLGHAAYVLEGAKKLKNVKSYRMKVEVKGKEIEKEFIFGMITNSKSAGGFKNITGKRVDLSDGLFEVTLVPKPSNAKELIFAVLSMLNRSFKTKSLIYFKASELKITSLQDDVSWTLDGEFGGTGKEFTINNKHKELKISV